MAEMRDELEICHNLENITCTNGILNEANEQTVIDETITSIESKTTNDPIVPT